MTTEAGTVTFSYDAAERVTDIVDSVAGTFEYSYNTNNGLVQTVEYPNDVSCSLDYDVMDRLTSHLLDRSQRHPPQPELPVRCRRDDHQPGGGIPVRHPEFRLHLRLPGQADGRDLQRRFRNRV